MTAIASSLGCIALLLMSRKVWRTAYYTKPRDRGIDPIGEAEVFLAYGRTEAATRVLQDLLADEPDNILAKIALLRVYLLERNVEAYCTLAYDVKAKLEHQSIWQTIRNRGQELDPSNPLFTT